MVAHGAVGLQHLGPGVGLAEALAADHQRVPFLYHGGDFARRGLPDAPLVDHAGARHPDDGQLLAFDLVLDDVSDDVAAVAALGHHGDLLGPLGQVVGQVDAAVAVPDELVHLVGLADEARLVHHRHRSPAEADDQVDTAVLEQASRDLADLFGVS